MSATTSQKSSRTHTSSPLRSPRTWLTHPIALLAATLAGAAWLFLALRDPSTPPSGDNLESWRRIAGLALSAFLPLAILLLIRGGGTIRTTVLLLGSTLFAFVRLYGDWNTHRALIEQSSGGEPMVPLAYHVELVLLGLLIVSPAPAYWLYRRSGILTRYCLRTFVLPFVFCTLAFIAIWLVFDLNDNLPDFRRGETPTLEILEFYAIQMPLMFTEIAPVSLLIAVVYAVSKLSRSSEILAMLGAGRSLPSILLPFFLFGAYVSFAFLVFNYEWSPWAEGHKESLLDRFRRGEKETTVATRHIYHNADVGRTWYIGRIPFQLSTESLRVVEVFQRDHSGQIRLALKAGSARWNPSNQTWTFSNCVLDHFDENGHLTRRETPIAHRESTWPETPWGLVSNRLTPSYLGVPQLLGALRNADEPSARNRRPTFATFLHHRWAAAVTCLIVVLIAAPLGIVYSRSSVLGGIASAIFLFAAILFLTELCLAFGQSGYLPPPLAAWLPNLLFGSAGLVLLYLRSTHQSFRLPGWRLRRNA